MSKAIKLKFEPNYEFTLIGLVTTEPIYKISWHLNEQLNILLKETNPLQAYQTKRQTVQEFSKFSFFTPEETNYHLIQNKGQQGILIEEQKQIDYWLKIERCSIRSEVIVEKIKRLKNVTLAFDIKPGSLKSKNRFIFSEEEI
ncbi:MAG: IPExxxVDY family protein [Salinivirgaceae bacterium]|jgi:hypothetical protein|nr:IPExxxVDY family protein [Salinivirgaceae bacterium]